MQNLQWQPTTQSGGAAPLPPYYVVLDLETTDPTPEEIEIERKWAATGNCKKPETIAAKKDGLKLATTDSAPIWAVGMWHVNPFRFVTLSQAVLSAEERSALAALGWEVLTVPDEVSLLQVYAVLFAQLPPQTRFIGAGDFDLHKSKFRFARHGLTCPAILSKHTYRDLMREWQEFTLRRDQPFLKVEEMAEKLGIAYSQPNSGADIPGLIAEGKHMDVLFKNYHDCDFEAQIAARLLHR